MKTVGIIFILALVAIAGGSYTDAALRSGEVSGIDVPLAIAVSPALKGG